MKSHELMLISVYPEMLEDIQAVCQTMHIEPTILQWEIAQQGLLDKLNQMFLELPKPDVIISRGATAGMIEQYLDRKSTRLNSSHVKRSRMPSSA